HVLLDGRGITGKPRMLERFLYGEFTAAATARLPGHGVFRTSKFAYVLHEPVLDPGRLGERAARRRGMNVRVFDNVEDAVQWLLQPESRDADSHFRPPSQWRTERASAEIDGSAHAPNQRL
ncbi:MAG: hypothetical protein ACRENP_27340, partial [Longimicrobiales bacterium]